MSKSISRTNVAVSPPGTRRTTSSAEWSAAGTAQDPLIGTTIGNYRIAELIGYGGMGLVYRGIHVDLERPVAIKLIHPDRLADGQAARFAREARTASAVSHSNVVRVYDFGELDGRSYLISEFVAGENLQRILDRQGTLSLADAGSYIIQTLDGLRAIAACGMIHRDIKPENLLITAQQQVKITDFGLAKDVQSMELTVHGEFLGTPLYMAAEQWANRPLDHRTDQYCLGVAAYRMLTGTMPYQGESMIEIYQATRETKPRAPIDLDPRISPAASQAVMRMLRPDPADRFPDHTACMAAWEDVLRMSDPPPRMAKSSPQVFPSVGPTRVLVETELPPLPAIPSIAPMPRSTEFTGGSTVSTPVASPAQIIDGPTFIAALCPKTRDRTSRNDEPAEGAGSPGDANPLVLSQVLFNQGQDQAALACLEKALESDCNSGLRLRIRAQMAGIRRDAARRKVATLLGAAKASYGDGDLRTVASLLAQAEREVQDIASASYRKAITADIIQIQRSVRRRQLWRRLIPTLLLLGVAAGIVGGTLVVRQFVLTPVESSPSGH